MTATIGAATFGSRPELISATHRRARRMDRAGADPAEGSVTLLTILRSIVRTPPSISLVHSPLTGPDAAGEVDGEGG
jgi:hypothetical protein